MYEMLRKLAVRWQILNWMQYFSPDRLVGELEEAGYAMRTLTGSLDGTELSDVGREFGVIAEARQAQAL